MESQQLLTQGQVFQDKVLPGAKDRKYPAEQMYQTPKHDRILAECAPWTQAPKSLILRMYGIMASHSLETAILAIAPTCLACWGAFASNSLSNRIPFASERTRTCTRI